MSWDGINAAAESRGESYLLWSVKLLTRINYCREEFTNKKDITLHLKGKSAIAQI